MIKRPIKAPTEPITDEELTKLTYPLVGSPKLDGFRCIIGPDGPLTSSMKPFQNKFIKKVLSDPCYKGLDGELIVGSPTAEDPFHNTSGPLRRFEGEPDFTFYAFDNFINGNQSYMSRWLSSAYFQIPRVKIIEQKLLYTPDSVLEFEKEMLIAGYEGAMIRSPYGLYKEGRCTFREMNIFKRKPFVEIEGVIIGFEEAMENLNEPILDERGLMKRSHNAENMYPKDTLGAFIVKCDKWPLPFRAAPGKGFTAEMRKNIWDKQLSYLGQIVTVKYQLYGSREAPRMPSVIKIRPVWDLSDE